MSSVEPLRYRHDNPSWTSTSYGQVLPTSSASTSFPASPPAASASHQNPTIAYQASTSHIHAGYSNARHLSGRVSVNSDAISMNDDDGSSIYSNAQQVTTYHSSLLQSNASSPYDEQYRSSWQTDNTNPRPDSNLDPFGFRQYESSRAPLPKVVVSSPSDTALQFSPGLSYEDDVDPVVPPTPPPIPQAQGRVPTAVAGAFNFSRPHRPPIVLGSEDQKQRVLARAAERSTGSLRPSSSNSSLNSASSSVGRNAQQDLKHWHNAPGTGTNGSANAMMASSSASPHTNASDAYPSPRPSPQGMHPPSLSPGVLPTGAGTPQFAQNTPSNSVPLPAKLPTVRVSTPESIYSDYSYYQLDSALPSPTSPISHSPDNRGVNSGPMMGNTTSSLEPRRSPVTLSPQAKLAEGAVQTPQQLVQLGIEYHEADKLRESAYCFERSATENGGCAVGMLMWGLSLRHGWGCPKDEARGFKWLQRAAEYAVVDLESAKDGREALKVHNRFNCCVCSCLMFVINRRNLSSLCTKSDNASSKAGASPAIRRWQW
jgi:hypothetical protein